MSGRTIRRAAAGLAVGVLAALAAWGGGSWFGAQPLRLPAGFPADVPLPAAARLLGARDQGKRGLSVVLEAPGQSPALAASFEEGMRARGWTVVERAVLEGVAYTTFRKGERSVAAGVRGGGVGATQMSLSVVERPYNEWEEGA